MQNQLTEVGVSLWSADLKVAKQSVERLKETAIMYFQGGDLVYLIPEKPCVPELF